MQRLQAVAAQLPVARCVLATSADAGTEYNFASICSTATPVEKVVSRLDGDDALLMYTSGSTGTPKGVRQTHRTCTAQIEALIDAWRVTAVDHVLNCLPLFHVGGLQIFSLPLLFRGGQVTLMPRWDPHAWLTLVASLQPTIGALISTMLIDVSNCTQDEPAAAGPLRMCLFGGSRTPPAPIERFMRGTRIEPVEMYGLTEVSGLAVTYAAGEQSREGSMGRVLEQILDWRIVPPGGGDPITMGSDAVGELWVRGDVVTPGYWKLPELDAQKLADGWLRTGDLVRSDADGYLYHVDRVDDMIVTGGENVYPQMIESHLASCPMIAEVAIIGTRHERWVQQVTAVIVRSEPGVTADRIIDYCASNPNLQGIQQPKRIEFVKALPRTGSGKLDRPQLRKMFS